MAGRGSKPGERRGGRKRGTPNKLTGDLKEMILGALDDAGGRAYLAKQALDNPSAFMTLVGKVLPLQLTGKDGGPIATTDVTELPADPLEASSAYLRVIRGGKS